MGHKEDREPRSEKSSHPPPDWLTRLRNSHKNLAAHSQTLNQRLEARRSTLSKKGKQPPREFERLNQELFDASTKEDAISCHGQLIQELALEILARRSAGEDLKSTRIKDMIELQIWHSAAIRRLKSSQKVKRFDEG